MATNTNHQPNSSNEPTERQNAILAEIAPHAIEFYKTLEVPASVPIATAYRGRDAQFIVKLPNNHTAEPDVRVVQGLKTLLRREQCDGIGIFSPINLHAHSDDDAGDRYGLCIEVHVQGASPLRRITELIRREADRNYFGPLAPCVGIPFGVIYPDLFKDQNS